MGASWIWILVGLVALFGISRGLTEVSRKNYFNKKVEGEVNRQKLLLDVQDADRKRDVEKQSKQIEKRHAELEKEYQDRKGFLDERDAAFRAGFLSGRAWLAAMIAEATDARDKRSEWLYQKKHSAPTAAETVAEIKREKRELLEKLKFSEYLIRSYEEYFPALEDYRELILDERVPLSAGADNLETLVSTDPSQLFLSREEWEALPTAKRNQLALDRYMSREKSPWEIGRLYERYIGHLRETAGWMVSYHGALKGFEDLGRDLICKKGHETEIIQAKCWSKSKTIHEKHLFQLFGTTMHFRLDNPFQVVLPVFVTTTALSNVATAVARELKIRVETVPLPSRYPVIKCNVNPSTAERIYHLPFDQQYDRTAIYRPGECYVSTTEEAEKLGFRRAWRHHPGV